MTEVLKGWVTPSGKVRIAYSPVDAGWTEHKQASEWLAKHYPVGAGLSGREADELSELIQEETNGPAT